jgi:hypothetical protein
MIGTITDSAASVDTLDIMTQTPEQLTKLPSASDRFAAEARAQAEAYDSIFNPVELPLEGGLPPLLIPPHPDLGMLDDDEMDAYTELQFERDTQYEREPDIYIPEQRLRDPKTGEETGVVLPSQTQPGNIKVPYRWADQAEDHEKGDLVKPSWSIRVVKTALGAKEYAKLRKGGRSSADVWRIWSRQMIEVKARQEFDSKSHGGTVDLAPVPPPDSE